MLMLTPIYNLFQISSWILDNKDLCGWLNTSLSLLDEAMGEEKWVQTGSFEIVQSLKRWDSGLFLRWWFIVFNLFRILRSRISLNELNVSTMDILFQGSAVHGSFWEMSMRTSKQHLKEGCLHGVTTDNLSLQDFDNMHIFALYPLCKISFSVINRINLRCLRDVIRWGLMQNITKIDVLVKSNWKPLITMCKWCFTCMFIAVKNQSFFPVYSPVNLYFSIYFNYMYARYCLMQNISY